jgi:hypothetical protein
MMRARQRIFTEGSLFQDSALGGGSTRARVRRCNGIRSGDRGWSEGAWLTGGGSGIEAIASIVTGDWASTCDEGLHEARG